MRLYLGQPGPAQLVQFSALLMVFSLVFSPFLLSISMWLLVFSGLWEAGRADQRAYARAHISVSGTLRHFFAQWSSRPELMLLALLFAVVALSGLWSDNTGYWLTRTRVRLPFIVLPLAFANLPILSDRAYKGVAYLAFWVVVLANFGTTLYFLANHDAILEVLGRGQPVPVPGNHIRFSLMGAACTMMGIWLLAEAFVLRYAWERKLMVGGILALIAMMHILAVRSGLVALYAGLLFSAGWLVIHHRKWVYGLVMAALLVTLPVLAWQTMPSIRQRVEYMVRDWHEYRAGRGNNYSDAQRWVSFETGIAIWQANPWLGVGTGDLPAAVQAHLEQTHPAFAQQPKLPHNQFIYVLAATGILGLTLSLAGLLAPWFLGTRPNPYMFWVMQLMVWMSFLVEYTLETAAGVAFCLFFTLWPLLHTKAHPAENSALLPHEEGAS
jgi:O-antigen ligase